MRPQWRPVNRFLGVGLACGVLAATAPAQDLTGRVEIRERKGLAADVDETLLWLEGAGLPNAAPQAVEVKTWDKAFSPRLLMVPVGSTVAFPNSDPFDHNVFSTSGPKPFDLGLYGQGETRAVTFDKPGLARIYCNVHARMSLRVLVHPTALVARPDRGGRFTLKGVPAGAYTLRAWHERGGEATMRVTVPMAEALVVTLDASRYRFTQHLDKAGKSYDARGRRY